MEEIRPVERRRRSPWRAAGIAVSLAVIAAAFFVLYRILRDIDAGEVIAAMRTTEPHELLLAGLLVAAAYFSLTFYDYFALRSIGRNEVPYRVASLAAFTSYSIGHNVGFSALSGGTVRYRIYSASGLSGVEVAKICFIAGLTFWLGNLTVLGIGMVLDPAAATAIDRLPEAVNRGLGVAMLAALLGYVGWVGIGPRRLFRDQWQVTLPGGKLTLLQILIGLADLMFTAAAMYVLMPDRPNIEFVSLLVIFVAATLLGFASYSPAGLGVFDAAMLLALPQFVKEDLVGALLLFRLFYYVIPFALSLAIVGLREFALDLPWLSRKIRLSRDTRKSGRDRSQV